MAHLNTMAGSLANETDPIAPCGTNCSVCSRYLARKHDVRRKGVKKAYCAGCAHAIGSARFSRSDVIFF